MGAVTVSDTSSRTSNPVKSGVFTGQTGKAWFDVSLSASYSPGGDTLNVSATFSRVLGATVAGRTPAMIGDEKYSYDLVPGHLLTPLIRVRAVDTTLGTQPADGTDLHLEGLRVEVEGILA